MALRIKFFGTTDLYLDSNHLSCEKNWTSHLALVGLAVGLQVDQIRLDFIIIKILYRLNYLDFYLVDTIAMLIIVLEVHFTPLYSKQSIF